MVASWEPKLADQLVWWPHMPLAYANGAIEEAITAIRAPLWDRRRTFRNQSRLDMTLDLMRLKLNKTDTVARYSALIHQHLENNHGHATATPRSIADPRTSKYAPGRVYSLR